MSASASDPVERIVLTPADRRPAVVEVISSARNTLSLSIFRCDEPAVLEALSAAVRRGVDVRVLLTRRAKDSKAHLKQLHGFLNGAGVNVRRYSDSVVRYHAKYIVVDETTVLIASLNFTQKCFQATCDFMLITHDSCVVGAVARLFEDDWRGINEHDSGGGAGDRIIVGPEQARSRFAGLFENAAHHIRIIDPKIDDPAMLALLDRRSAAGVRVEIRGAKEVGSFVPHGKLLMIDDSLAVIGSISLSSLALEFRRELAVVTRETTSLATLDQFWRSLPATATADDAPGVSGDPILPA